MPCHNETPRKVEPADPKAPPQPVSVTLKWAIWAFIVLIAALLLFEHRLHLNVILPWLLLGGCLVMHLFMHRGHGRHDDGPGHAPHHGKEQEGRGR